MPTNKVHVHTTIDRELWDSRLKKYALSVGVDRNRVIEEALKEYLTTKEYEKFQQHFFTEER